MKHNKALVLLIFLLSIVSLGAFAKEIDLIDNPTADVLLKRNYRIVSRVFPEGGLLVKGQLGIFARLMVGVSYGGTDIISNDSPAWYSRLEFMIRYRLIDEGLNFPAVAVGFDSQGYGSYSGLHNRYDVKARGLYTVLSKGFARLMGLRVHLGLNYNNYEGDNGRNKNNSDDGESKNAKKPSKDRNGNLEDKRNDDLESLNGFLGLDFPFNPQVTGIVEYDVANNDNRRDDLYGNGPGFLNAAFRWRVNTDFQCEFGLKDILRASGNLGRYVSLNYENKF